MPERAFRELLEATDLPALTVDRRGDVVFANAALLGLLGLPEEEVLGRSWGSSFLAEPDAGRWSAVLADAIQDGTIARRGRCHLRCADGSVHEVEFSNTLLRSETGEVIGVAGLGTDIGVEEARRHERELLAAAVDSAHGSILITGPDGTLAFVNPAFERATGYRREEVLGRHPRDLFTPVERPQIWREMAETLRAGGTWTGEWAIRCRDGRVIREEATVSPIVGPTGTAVKYVAVTRDVTGEREMEARLDREIRERGVVSAALARLEPAGTPEATATRICEACVALDGIDHAAVVEFRSPDEALVLARIPGDEFPVAVGELLPSERGSYLHESARRGPWAEPWRVRPEDGEYGSAVAATPARAFVYAPIRRGDETLGVVILGTNSDDRIDWLMRQTGVAMEFAATAGVLLTGWLEADRRSLETRRTVGELIGAGAFAPVFQPIRRLATDVVAGYEALTRFDDGTRPDRWFREAWAVGLGADLELATLAAALDAARRLPRGGWLDLNVSPRLVIEAAERLAATLAATDRDILLEITEHDEVADYLLLRRRIASLGRRVHVAVDDAGAGVANFTHIVELHPDAIKLDCGLVRAVDTDLGRQALVVAMRHFAKSVGCRLIAEGVETAGEAAKIAELGIEYAQGHWYGKPLPVDELVGASHGRPLDRAAAVTRTVLNGVTTLLP